MGSLFTNYERDYAEFKKNGYLDSYSGGLISLSEKGRFSVKNNPISCITFPSRIDGERLQKAVDKALLCCPHMAYQVHRIEGKWPVRYTLSDRPYTVLEGVIPEYYGDDEMNNHYSFVSFSDDRLTIGFCHAITDHGGSSMFYNSIIRNYFDLPGSDTDYKESPIYAADVLKYDLPVSEGFVPFKREEGEFFSDFPKDNSCFVGNISIGKDAFVSYVKGLNTSKQVAVSMLLAMAIRDVYSDYKGKICIRGPVDTRRSFGLDGTFQNCSYPHTFLDLSVDDISSDRIKETAVRLKSDLKKQLDTDNLAWITNRLALIVKTDDPVLFRSLISEYVFATGILVSNIGAFGASDTQEYIKDFSLLHRANFPISVYFGETSDRVKFIFMQQFGSQEIFEAFKKIITTTIGEDQ